MVGTNNASAGFIEFGTTGRLTLNEVDVSGLGSTTPSGGLRFNGTLQAAVPTFNNSSLTPVAGGAALEFMNEELSQTFPDTVTFVDPGGNSVNVLRQATTTTEAGNYLIFLRNPATPNNGLYGEDKDSDLSDRIIAAVPRSQTSSTVNGSVLFPVNDFALLSAEYFDDVNKDGLVDRIQLTFNDVVDDQTILNFGPGDVMISGLGVTVRGVLTDSTQFDNRLNL